MKRHTKLQRMRTSVSLVIPMEVVKAAGLKAGDYCSVEATKSGEVVIKKDSMVPGLTVRAEMVRIKGHRDCLESMAPVLAAVKASLGELHEYYCSPVQPCPLCETLADALAALGLEVGE